MGYGDVKREIKQKMGDEPNLICSAHGCNQKWSVNTETVHRLCSYHAWEPASKWPGITESLSRDGPWQLEQKRTVDTTLFPGDPKAWAKRLQERDQSGEHLSHTQRAMYQEALRIHPEPA